MKMEWTEVIAENFLSFERLVLKLSNRGIVLIEGTNLTSNKFKSNGSGKSSALEPLVYAIYDTTSKGIKSDEVINNKVGKNTAVILKGKQGKDEYRIERYRKHKKHKNKVLLFLNDKEITAKSTADTNKMIQAIVGIDYNTFVNSIMFSQGSGAGRFAIATDKEKKEILENLVNLQVYADAQDIAKNRVRDKVAEIAAKDREEERLQWELSQVDNLEQQDRQRYESTKASIEREEQDFEKVKEAMNNYINTTGQTIPDIISRAEKLKEQRDAIQSNVKNPHAQAVNEALNALNEVRNQQRQLEYEKSQQIEAYKKLMTNTNCPVCGSELDTSHRDQEVARIKEKLNQILLKMQPLAGQLSHWQAVHDEAHAQYMSIKEEQDNIVNNYRQVSHQIDLLEREQQTYSNYLNNYKSKLNTITVTLSKLREVPEPAPRDEERKAIHEKIKAVRDAKLSLHKEKNQLEDTVKVFSNSGVKSHVLDLITPFLNERANKYLGMLSGSDMELSFSTQTPKKDGEMTEKFDVKLTNAAGGDSYKSNSEGEKKRADLAIALALQDLVMSGAKGASNVVVYDEVFDALDSVGAENVVTLLRERQKEIGTIFVVTHNETLKPLFEQVITVVKDKTGVSKLDEGDEMT
ncbi:recombination exonuclease subunit 2 [Phage f2b1]|nr:recombination exonuclease subunit 2 [Phage f2b1]